MTDKGGEEKRPNAEKYTQEQVLELVKQQHEDGRPVVTTKWMVEATEYSQARIGDKLDDLVDEKKLNKMDAGSCYLYWVPDDTSERLGEVTVEEFTRYDDIEPEKVPLEKSKEIALTNLEGYRDENWWQERNHSAQTIFGYSLLALIAGFVGLVIGDTRYYNLSTSQENMLAIFIFGGVSFAILSFIGMLLSGVGGWLVQKGLLPENPQQSLRKTVSQVKQKIRN